jgi:phage shock protein C
MSSRQKQRTAEQEPLQQSLQVDDISSVDLDRLSQDELESILFEPDAEENNSLLNLPNLAGLALIGVGVAYLFQQLDFLQGVDLTMLANMLPFVAGILIILVGFGVLSWSPNRTKDKTLQTKTAPDVTPEDEASLREALKDHLRDRDKKKRSRLTKSRFNKKISGVCGGLAEYFNIDPTLVRIVFVAGTIFSSGTFILLYIALALILDKPDDLSSDEVISIIRDS